MRHDTIYDFYTQKNKVFVFFQIHEPTFKQIPRENCWEDVVEDQLEKFLKGTEFQDSIFVLDEGYFTFCFSRNLDGDSDQYHRIHSQRIIEQFCALHSYTLDGEVKIIKVI